MRLKIAGRNSFSIPFETVPTILSPLTLIQSLIEKCYPEEMYRKSPFVGLIYSEVDTGEIYTNVNNASLENIKNPLDSMLERNT